MKTDVFYKAQELHNSIHHTQQAIEKIESKRVTSGDPALNFILANDEDKEQIKQAVLRILKKKLVQYKKGFELLK